MTPTLLTLVRRALTGEARIARGAAVLAAVSGGPDSMALLHVLARLAPKLGIVVHAHGVDHGLRPSAVRELDTAEAFARHLGVSFGRSTVRVTSGGNLQARARTARYAALAEAARATGAAAIATAHHADDRAETVLLRLMRGAGPRGLAVLPPRAPLPAAACARHAGARGADAAIELVRPLLRARRPAVIAHLERHGVPFATDPSNEDPRYLRTRVRRELLPLLEELSAGIVDHLVALADQLASERSDQACSFPLPRSTQTALEELMRTRSATARVWLPGGLVASVDPRAGAATADKARAGRGAPD